MKLIVYPRWHNYEDGRYGQWVETVVKEREE